MILEHLVDPDYQIPEALPPGGILSAQLRTLNWLDEPMPEADANAKSLARTAFTSLVSPDENPERAKKNLLALRAPEAVQHLVTMLDAYSWEFVQEAHKIRGYICAQLLEESKAGDARIRLRSLELLGKLTEVAAFSERVEVIHKHEDVGEVEERIRARLKAMLPPQQAPDDVEIKDIAIVKQKERAPE